jgi:hypothetical protein
MFWFLGGNDLFSNWVDYGIVPMIQRGDNPGNMWFQPFK